jgi:membrane protein YdbS with pleckstrin-like domain
MPEEPRYWFPAKTYGWGWGPPATWQGWVVIAVFVLLIAIGAMSVLPAYGNGPFVAYAAVVTLALCVVCWWKGEPPAWRWGRK